MRFTPKTLKDFQPSFALRLSVDFSSMTVIDGKKFYPTVDRNGCLVIHEDGTVQWISETFFE